MSGKIEAVSKYGYTVGEELEIVSACGFKPGEKVTVSGFTNDGGIILDDVAEMNVDIVDTHMRKMVVFPLQDSELRKQLLKCCDEIQITVDNEEPPYHMLIAAIELPTKAIEVITNSTNLQAKLEYYKNAYDHKCRLKTNPDVRIVGIMLV